MGTITECENPARQYVACPLCDSNNSHASYSQVLDRPDFRYELRIVKCNDCGLLYVNPLYKTEALKYYINLDDAFEEMRSRSVLKRKVFQEVIDSIEKLNSNNKRWKILDIGCGTGVFLDLLRIRGYEVSGIEPAERQAHQAREWLKLDVVTSSKIGNHFAPESFDVATMLDSLEHIEKPLPVLENARRCIKRGGYLIVRVPNGPFHLCKAKLLLRTHDRNCDWMGVSEHVVHYGNGTIRAILKRSGFEILSVRNSQLETLPSGRGPLDTARRAKWLINNFMKVVGNCLRMPLGPTLFVIAKKGN